MFQTFQEQFNSISIIKTKMIKVVEMKKIAKKKTKMMILMEMFTVLVGRASRVYTTICIINILDHFHSENTTRPILEVRMHS